MGPVFLIIAAIGVGLFVNSLPSKKDREKEPEQQGTENEH
jgi:hypothetical protein